MNWVGLADAHEVEFDLTGLSNRTRRQPVKLTQRPDALACRGTLMLEADVAAFTVPRDLISHGLGASFKLSVAFGRNDHLDFMLSIGDGYWEHRLPLNITDEVEVVRITYAWDAATRAAVLSVYQPRSQHLAQVLVPAPRPVPWAALRALIHDAPEMCRVNDVSFVALSRAFEPAGPMPGLTRRCEIATPLGMRPIGDMDTGDVVLTPRGAACRVLAQVRRRLPARGSFAPYVLRAPSMGLEHDLTLSAESLVELEGSDVEYLLGTERVLAQARQIGERQVPLTGLPPATVTYHQLILDSVEILDAGVGLATLNLGTAAPTGLSSATTLWADAAGHMPRGHGPAPHPLARAYEVVTLNAGRAA